MLKDKLSLLHRIMSLPITMPKIDDNVDCKDVVPYLTWWRKRIEGLKKTNVIPVDLSNVAKYYAESDKDFSRYDSIPNWSPPWQFFLTLVYYV